MHLRTLFFTSATFVLLSTTQGSYAKNQQSYTGAQSHDLEHSEQSLPLYIQAHTISFDKKTNVVVAEGDVEISQFLAEEKTGTLFHFDDEKTDSKNKSSEKKGIKERYLKADHLSYNRDTGEIIALGHVIFIDEEKNVLFAEHMKIDEKFDNGFVAPLKILLANEEGRITAQKGQRKQGNRTVFSKATYSPCHICEAKPLPLWQIRSHKVTHDQVKREIRYNNAYLDIFGVPVLYMPYFKHPDPGIKRKTGFLMPLFGNSTDLGFVAQIPYFWVLGPHNDLTISPVITTKQGPVFVTEYRHRYTRGDAKVGGSITRNTSLNRHQIRANQPSLPTPSKTRYHLYTKGRFEMNADHLLTFDLIRASDTTYLRRYSMLNRKNAIMQNKNLTSEIKLERFKSNSYGSIRTFAFQTDTPKTTPYVFPLAQYMYKSDPCRFNETYRFDGNFLSLIRKRDRPGLVARNSSRAIGNAGVNLPYVNSIGHLYEMDMNVRGDLYQIGTYQRPGATRASSYSTARTFPTASFTWRYPLMRPVFGTP